MKEFIYEESNYLNQGEYNYFNELMMKHDFMVVDIKDDKEFNLVFQYLGNLTEKAPDFLSAYEYALQMIHCLEPDKELSELQLDMETRWHEASMRIAQKEDVFNKEVAWGWMENRPLIRGLYNGADRMWKEGKLKEAHELFSKILKTNENDNIGARYSVKATKEKISHEDFEKRFTYEENGGVFYNGELEKWFGES